MTAHLDLFDVQGDVIHAYASDGYFFSRYILLHFHDGNKGRDFLGALIRIIKITTGASFGDNPDEGEVPRPRVTTNIAFTYEGLKVLGVPRETLRGFPSDFIMGMQARHEILGDNGASAPKYWDPVWHNAVHALVSLNALTKQDLENHYQRLLNLPGFSSAGASGERPETIADTTEFGVTILRGHCGDDGAKDLPYQEGNVLFDDQGKPTPREHFGYTDGITDPIIEGMPKSARRAIGRGKQTIIGGDGGWQPLENGEFLLGNLDEAHEYPPAPMPFSFSRNGTYMAYRKLHENVGTFNTYLDEQAKKFGGNKELLAAKFVGRWRDNGAPLTAAPDETAKKAWDEKFESASKDEKDKMLADLVFDDDLRGLKCPFSAHIRRMNPRASLENGVKGAFDTPGALANRRRVMRRGLPYGNSQGAKADDKGNHGIIIMLLNASIERQFEFVQQQWVNYGNDFNEANDKEIITGNHDGHGRVLLPVDPKSDKPPFFLNNIPRFVEVRGGEYFFIPSISSLTLIADGMVDPT